jgi:hypothetical protein
MSKTDMTIDSRSEDTAHHILYLRGHHTPPGLTEIDIFQGAPNCPTTGRVGATSAYATVNPVKYAQIKSSAQVGVKIALSYSYNSQTKTNDVTDVQCPELAAFARELEILVNLSERQLELMQEKAQSDAQLLKEIQAMHRTLARLLPVGLQRDSDINELVHNGGSAAPYERAVGS